jgi:DNA-binding MarR family transcriptional regulator
VQNDEQTGMANEMAKKEPLLKHGDYTLPPSWKERYHRTFPDLPVVIFDAIYALRRTAQRVDNSFAAWLADTGLSPAKVGVLMLMWAANDEPVSFSQLGAQLSVTRATISGLVDGLARDGYLVRIPDSADRRNVLAALSEEGRGRLQHVMDIHCQRLSSAFGDIDPKELKTLTKLLNHLADRAESIS